MLKVMKLNEERSKELSSQFAALKREQAEELATGEQFFRDAPDGIAVSGGDGAEACAMDSKWPRRRLQERSWDDLLEEANQRFGKETAIGFEDLLTQEELQDACDRWRTIDREFALKTGLRWKEFGFLTVAIALQCVRQYVIDPWLRKKRPSATSNDEKGHKDDPEPGWYYVDTGKILTNRVPFDAQKYGENQTIQGFLEGGDHRLMTLGHDPVLGWVFGTMNIMTGTLTRRDFASAHVKHTAAGNVIHSRARTERIVQEVVRRVSKDGLDGKLALGCALLREGIHLKSDVGTKRSLPLPGIGAVSPEAGKMLAKYGIDTASVGTEVSLAMLVNCLIAMMHRWTFDGPPDEQSLKFHEVRTRKILLYSNLIASSSNILVTIFTKNAKLLDVGGLLVTIVRLFSDVRFMCKIRDEYVRGKIDGRFEGIRREVDELYEKTFS